jgi:hypothetical protein
MPHNLRSRSVNQPFAGNLTPIATEGVLHLPQSYPQKQLMPRIRKGSTQNLQPVVSIAEGPAETVTMSLLIRNAPHALLAHGGACLRVSTSNGLAGFGPSYSAAVARERAR